MIYDVIIIGAGPAGISAAIYAKRSGMNALVLEKGMPGGLVNYTSLVENYPGYKNISGPDLAMKFYEHLLETKVEVKAEEAIKIIPGEIKKVITKNGEYQTKTVIIACGRKARELGLENEAKFAGNGISYCALCDGPLYKNKVVAVYGGGNSAFEEGLFLSGFAKEVIILNRSKSLRADNVFQERLKAKTNIKFFDECKITKLNGNEKLESVEINNNETIALDGLFVYIGFLPATDFVKELDICNEQGYIIVNDKYETKIPGVFAVGDADSKNIYQIVTAISEGAIAAVNAYTKISN
jgi:thioredoxin reductase (NADPH)